MPLRSLKRLNYYFLNIKNFLKIYCDLFRLSILDKNAEEIK